jgi:hypothetical protein
LLASGLKPEVFVIEEVRDDQWEEAEMLWIQYMKFVGASLTNGTKGGDGLRNPSDETRKKIGDATRGKKRSFSKEHLEKLTARCKAMTATEQWRAKARISLAKARVTATPRIWTEEDRARMSKLKREVFAKLTPEQRVAFAMKGVAARAMKRKSA